MSMTVHDALQSLGAYDAALADDEKTFLDEQGYLVLGQLFTDDEMLAIRTCLDRLGEQEGDDAGKEVHQEAGTLRLSNTIEKDAMFERCICHPRLLAAVHHILGVDFKLSALNARAALPGGGRQAFHADWEAPVPPGDCQVCIGVLAIDDFTAENGATLLVPGSHRWAELPADGMTDPMADHPDQIQMTAPAGSVIFLNSHIWHAGAENRTTTPRRAIHPYFCRRTHDQQLNQKKHLSRETVERLSPELRVILDV